MLQANNVDWAKYMPTWFTRKGLLLPKVPEWALLLITTNLITKILSLLLHMTTCQRINGKNRNKIINKSGWGGVHCPLICPALLWVPHSPFQNEFCSNIINDSEYLVFNWWVIVVGYMGASLHCHSLWHNIYLLLYVRRQHQITLARWNVKSYPAPPAGCVSQTKKFWISLSTK